VVGEGAWGLGFTVVKLGGGPRGKQWAKLRLTGGRKTRGGKKTLRASMLEYF